MPIVAVFQSPTLTRESYGAVVMKLTGGKRSRMESPADWGVAGNLAHIAGDGANGFRVIDVWESEDGFRKFGERLMPILQEAGVDVKPDVFPAHAFVK